MLRQQFMIRIVFGAEILQIPLNLSHRAPQDDVPCVKMNFMWIHVRPKTTKNMWNVWKVAECIKFAHFVLLTLVFIFANKRLDLLYVSLSLHINIDSRVCRWCRRKIEHKIQCRMRKVILLLSELRFNKTVSFLNRHDVDGWENRFEINFLFW